VLDQCVDEHGDDWPAVLADYETRRKPNGDAIADLALQNFVEMRDLVRDPIFQLKRKIERRLADLVPDEFVPTYSMVTFSQMPYAEAKARGEQQDRLLGQIAATPDIEQRLPTEACASELLEAYRRWRDKEERR